MTESRPVDLDIEGLQDPVEVGIGGFATVYRASQPAFRRTVAVKVLAALNLDEAARERFERECQAMGSLSDHPNIVTVYGAGFTKQSGRPYLVMAYLPGGSLQERIDREGAIPWQDATLYAVHLAGALETAHRAQIVHRDIKPANVLMSPFGDAQLTDFGIARISGGHETQSGVITASMAHAPPEVLDGQRPTVAADVYSLGSTIFELMHGAPAFSSASDESMVPMLRRILTDPPPDLRSRGVPDQVCQVIERAMAKATGQRQISAVQFGREMQAARRALGLDPGKLTVPADVSVDIDDGQEINFVAAPLQTAPIDPQIAPAVPPSPSYVPPVSPTQPVAPAPNQPVGPAPTGPVEPYAPAAYGAVPAYTSTPPAPGVAAYAAPPQEPPKPSSKALLVGVGIFAVLVLAGIVAVVLTASRGTDVAGGDPSTTVTTVVSTSTTEDIETTETTNTTVPAGYTQEMENTFVDACVAGPDGGVTNSRLLCRCVFKGIRDQIAFDRFLEIEKEVGKGTALATTEIQPIIEDCAVKHPATGGATDTPS
jgi:serine/threonine protein kinase